MQRQRCAIENIRPVISHYSTPFRMLLVGRNWRTGSDYRYGFNGKEADLETYGEGNIYDYGFRIYNPRLGKFLSVDPLTQNYPWYTPYQFDGNTPIWAIDLDGLEEWLTNDGKKVYGPVNPESDLTISGSSTSDGSYSNPIEELPNTNDDYGMKLPDGSILLNEVNIISTRGDGINGVLSEDNATVFNTNYNPCHPEGYYLSVYTADIWANRDVENGQYFAEIPEWLDFFLYRTYVNDGTRVKVTPEGYITGGGALPIGGPIEIVGFKGKMIPSKFFEGITLEEQGVTLAKSINTNNVYIRTVNGANRYSFAGKIDNGVKTPHYHPYQKNYVNGELKSIAKIPGVKKPIEMNQQDIRIVRKYIEKQNKKY